MSSSVVSSDSHVCLAVFNLLLGCSSGCSGAGDGSLITGIGEDAASNVSEWSLYYNNNIGKISKGLLLIIVTIQLNQVPYEISLYNV